MFISFNFEIAFREIHKKANRTNELSILIKYNKFLKVHQHWYIESECSYGFNM